MEKKVTVAHRGVSEGQKPVPTELIAESIVELSRGMKQLRAGRLNNKAIGVLLSQSTKLSQRACLQVVDALEDLEAQYIRKKERS